MENLDGPSYEALKREVKQAAERYREIAEGKPGIAELARGIITKFRVKIQKQAQSKKEKNQFMDMKF